MDRDRADCPLEYLVLQRQTSWFQIHLELEMMCGAEVAGLSIDNRHSTRFYASLTDVGGDP